VNGYTIAGCQGCSLVFVQNIPTSEELAAHYQSGGDPTYADDNLACLSHYFRRLRALIEARVSPPGKLLDVGCSAGWFLDTMDGWECHGCEISADADIARQRHGDRIFKGSLEEYPSSEGAFDVITLQDVFDHIPEPMTALAKCYRMLKPGGLLVIKVHNISCLYAKLSGRSFYAIIPPSHLFYYNKRTLAQILSKTGFRMVESRFISHLLRISTVFLRLSKMERDSVFYRIFTALERSRVGDIKIRKNLRDIITVAAVKQ
jgi:2-polyprenyl-3-methyl-5-hydroxy-6-metoxy-1,4-benzoquinol methylase